MTARKAYLRADFSPILGFGHVFRAFGLAETLQRNGFSPEIWSRRLPGAETSLAKLPPDARGIRIFAEEAEFAAVVNAEAGQLLFFDLRESADYTGLPALLAPAFANNTTICFDTFYEDQLRFSLTVRPYFSSLHPPASDRFLPGPKYFIFRRELKQLALSKAPFQAAQKILITLGGGDPSHASAKVVKALCPVLPEKHFIVVLGPGFSADDRELIPSLARIYPNLEVADAPEHLGHLYAAADLAITSGGLTKYETALFGLPTLVLAHNDQEEELSLDFQKLGTSFFLGRADALDYTKLAETLLGLDARDGLWRDMSKRGREVTDANGDQRIIDHLKQRLP